MEAIRAGGSATKPRSAAMLDLLPIAATGMSDEGIASAGKAVALGVGAGLGSVGAGIGIGIIFGKEIEAVARQPEMKQELQSVRWLGFALTEAVAFYTFIFGLIAFFLS
jgi:F-type H+-transporting ATPase subunit c